MIVPRALLPTALVLLTSLGLVKAQCPLEITGLPTFTGIASLDTMPLLLPFGLQAGVFINGTSVTANGPTEITVLDGDSVNIQASVNDVDGLTGQVTVTGCGASTPYVLDVSPYFCNLVVDLAAGDKIQFNSGGSPYPPIEGYGQATVPIDTSISYTYYTGGSAVSGTFNVGTCSNAVSCTGSGCGTTGNSTCFATLVGLPTIMVSQEEPNVHYFDFFTDIIFPYFKLDNSNGPFGPLMEGDKNNGQGSGYLIEAEIGENLNGGSIFCGCTVDTDPTPCDVSSLYCELAIDADNVVIEGYNSDAGLGDFMIDDKVWVLVNTEVYYCDVPGCNPDKDEDGISFNVGNCDRTLPGGVTQETPEDLIRKACPCEIFTNHGQKQSCVNDKAKQLVKTGVITSEEKNALVDLFNKSKCPTTRSLRNGGR